MSRLRPTVASRRLKRKSIHCEIRRFLWGLILQTIQPLTLTSTTTDGTAGWSARAFCSSKNEFQSAF